VTHTRNPRALHFLSQQPGGSRLAHWPPQRGKDTDHVIMKPQPDEPVEPATPRGSCLTRTILGEFHDDE